MPLFNLIGPMMASTTTVGKSDDSTKAKGGLKVEAHPALLLDQSGKLDLKRVAALIPKPNFATVKVSYIKIKISFVFLLNAHLQKKKFSFYIRKT